jgi:hypothetical protein
MTRMLGKEFHVSWGKRFRGASAGLRLKGSRRFPMMGSKKASDIRCAGDLEIVASLGDVEAIEGRHKSFIDKWRLGFSRQLKLVANGGIEIIGNGWIWRGKSKIVNLTKKENGNIV